MVDESERDGAQVRGGFDGLFSGGRKKAKRKGGKALDIPGLAKGFELLYHLPPTVFALSGNGSFEDHAHWPLNTIEAQTLTREFLNACGEVDNKAFLAFMRMVEKAIPWVTLATTAWIITAPRVKASAEVLRVVNDSRRTEKTIRTPDPIDRAERGDAGAGQADPERPN